MTSPRVRTDGEGDEDLPEFTDTDTVLIGCVTKGEGRSISTNCPLVKTSPRGDQRDDGYSLYGVLVN